MSIRRPSLAAALGHGALALLLQLFWVGLSVRHHDAPVLQLALGNANIAQA